jgi:hypothetical protein
MMFDNATKVYRKFGVAERRDLRFLGPPFCEIFSTEQSEGLWELPSRELKRKTKHNTLIQGC